MFCALALCSLAPTSAQEGDDDLRIRAVESFLDEFFTREMASLWIPGAVVVFVEGGKVSIAKGYGVADLETERPVDPETTRFRIASVGKTFTALAALKAVEDGRLDLDENIDRYLRGFSTEHPGWDPVTLHHLLVHTGGFDERLIGYLADGPDDFEPLADYLARRMPPRSQPPGEVTSYSNHGFALAGHLVESVVGRPFHEHADLELFRPLGMSRTGYLTPPLAPLVRQELAREYWSSGQQAELRFSRPYPAGSMATTGRDMGRFLVALLFAMEGDGGSVITPGVAALMTERQFSQRQDLPGYAYGLGETTHYGRRLLVKGGSGPAHSAVIAVIPEASAGLFVALNRQEPQLWTRLLPELIGRFFPGDAAAASTSVTSKIDLSRLEGSYRMTRIARRSMEKVFGLALQASVSTQDGQLSVRAPEIGELRWNPSGPLRFAREDGSYLAFAEDERGRISYLYIGMLGEHFAFERVTGTEETSTLLLLLAGLLAILLSLPLIRGCARLVRLVTRRKRRERTAVERWTAFAAQLTVLLEVLALAGVVVALSGWRDLLMGATPLLLAALSLLLLAVVGTLTLVALLAISWKTRIGSVSGRVHLTLVTLASLVLLWIAHGYNLIGFRL